MIITHLAANGTLRITRRTLLFNGAPNDIGTIDFDETLTAEETTDLKNLLNPAPEGNPVIPDRTGEDVRIRA